MSDMVKREDCLKVIDRFIGYLDEDMIYRIKLKLKQDVPTVDESSIEKERIIKALENEKDKCIKWKRQAYDYYAYSKAASYEIAMEKSIEIVKAGGIDE